MICKDLYRSYGGLSFRISNAKRDRVGKTKIECTGDLACIWNSRMLGADLDCP
jgi:hypothetical protein